MATIHLHGEGNAKVTWSEIGGVYWLDIRIDGMSVHLCLEAKDAGAICDTAGQMVLAMNPTAESGTLYPEGEPLTAQQIRGALKPGDMVADYKASGEVEFPE